MIVLKKSALFVDDRQGGFLLHVYFKENRKDKYSLLRIKYLFMQAVCTIFA